MKPERVVFIDAELEHSFEQLSGDDPIKKGLVKAIKDIQEDAFCGRNVRKNLIPKELIIKWGVNNL